jgi:hypothetical protein
MHGHSRVLRVPLWFFGNIWAGEPPSAAQSPWREVACSFWLIEGNGRRMPTECETLRCWLEPDMGGWGGYRNGEGGIRTPETGFPV